jgi:hypothetical protein
MKHPVRFDVLNNGLQKLKAPRIIELRRDQPLLHDSKDGSYLSRTKHLWAIPHQECFQELYESGDAAFLLPDGGSEQEGEEAPILSWDVSGLQFKHLSENLEDVGDVFWGV